MFEDLKQAISHHIVDELLKLLHGDITIRVQQPAPQRKAPRNLRTNVDDLARASGQSKTDGEDDRVKRLSSRRNAPSRGNGRASAAAQASRPSSPARIGRNDPCPCGSGKKYKKCHGA